MYAGLRHVISGEPESGKSWLALAWSREVLKAGGVVVYIDHEMGAPMTLERLRTLGIPSNVIPRFRYVEPTEPANLASPQIGELVQDASLVIIDSTVGSLGLHGYDDNKSLDIEAWYQRVVDPLRISGAAIVVLDHVTKNAESRGKYAIGSQRKVGAADVHLSVEAITPFGRHRLGKAKVVVQKDRPGHLQRPTLGTFTLDPAAIPNPYSWEPYTASDDEGSWKPTILMEQIERFLEKYGPSSKNMIEQNIEGKAKYVREAIDALEKDDKIKIERAESGRGGGLLISLKKTPTSNLVQPRPNLVPDEVHEPRPPYEVGDERSRDEVQTPNLVPGTKFTPLPRPCPICRSLLSEQPYHANGGTYCCEACAQGDTCPCKYLKAPA